MTLYYVRPNWDSRYKAVPRHSNGTPTSRLLLTIQPARFVPHTETQCSALFLPPWLAVILAIYAKVTFVNANIWSLSSHCALLLMARTYYLVISHATPLGNYCKLPSNVISANVQVLLGEVWPLAAVVAEGREREQWKFPCLNSSEEENQQAGHVEPMGPMGPTAVHPSEVAVLLKTKVYINYR